MKTNIYIIASILLSAAILFSCKDEPTPPVEPDIKIHAGETAQLPIEYAPWTSERNFIAEVNDEGIVKANHVGVVNMHGKDTSFVVEVEARYHFAPYPEPICEWNIRIGELRKLDPGIFSMFGETFQDFDDGGTMYTYFFDESFKYDEMQIIMTTPKTKLDTQLIKNYLAERYELVYMPASEGETNIQFYDCYVKYENKKILNDTSNTHGYFLIYANKPNGDPGNRQLVFWRGPKLEPD